MAAKVGTAIDLSGQDLSKLNLSAAVLKHAVLRNAKLDGTVLAMADLSTTDLRGACLERATLNGANLTNVIASPMVLRSGDGWPANFSKARMGQVNASAAALTGARLDDADLRQAMLRDAI